MPGIGCCLKYFELGARAHSWLDLVLSAGSSAGMFAGVAESLLELLALLVNTGTCAGHGEREDVVMFCWVIAVG